MALAHRGGRYRVLWSLGGAKLASAKNPAVAGSAEKKEGTPMQEEGKDWGEARKRHSCAASDADSSASEGEGEAKATRKK